VEPRNQIVNVRSPAPYFTNPSMLGICLGSIYQLVDRRATWAFRQGPPELVDVVAFRIGGPVSLCKWQGPKGKVQHGEAA
jgi:hypothetical protein